MTLLRFLTVIGLSYLLYGLYLSHYNVKIVANDLVNKEIIGPYDYKGIVNVHGLHLEGSNPLNDIVEAGQEAGLDFLFFNELNDFSLLGKKNEGYFGRLLVLYDGEYSYLNSRLLNLGATATREISGPGQAQVFFSDMLSQTHRNINQGIFVLAHPFKPKYSWIGEYPVGLDGIEIINLKSAWQNGWLKSRWSFLWSMIIFPFNEQLSLLRLFTDPIDEVQLWDELNIKRKTLGIAGVDSGTILHFGQTFSFHFPSYKTLFSLVSNHILLNSELTGDLVADRKKIINALALGQFYFSLDILGNPKGFNARILSEKGESFSLGSELTWRRGLQLEIHLSQKPQVPFEVEVYKDGEKIFQTNATETKTPIPSPGVYRVKVRVIPNLPFPKGKKWKPWIFTNPFYVR
ncbi:MAG: hypothetical protein K1X29_09915 [Bdellovibrionales bacterium]|nr:hypothetical protein [Bdellovibrionales bacterium]